MEKSPPKYFFSFLRWICPEHLYEEIEGDLMQRFHRDAKTFSERKARRRFIWNTIRFFRPGIVLRNKISTNFLNVMLFGNYIKVSFRYLLRKKTFAIVNILGLALGMAAALLIYQYTDFEKSYDSFHENLPDIYRITTAWNPETTPQDKRATTVPWSGPGVKEAFPEVLDYTRFASLSVMTGDNTVRFGDKKIAETKIYLADPGFLRIFSFTLIEGDPLTALGQPHQIILTESIAKKYFGSESPLGKSLSMDTHDNLSGNEFIVTGIIQDPPENSHMVFDFLISYNSMWDFLANGSTFWHWDNTYCYLLLHPDADVRSLERKMSALRVKQFAHEFGTWTDVIDFKLQPLRDIHLYSSLKGEISQNGDGRALNFLGIIGIFILVSAYINYINLSTAKAVERRTEIGVRKVVGSSRTQLMLQLLVESLIINLMAVVLCLAIARSSVPVLSDSFNINWPIWNADFFSVRFLIVSGGIVVAGTVLSALYPALVLTSFKPAEVLKGSKPIIMAAGNRWTFRKSLTVFQFVFCIGFTTATFVVYQQLEFMKNHDLGMNMDQVIVVRAYGFQSYDSYRNFKARLSSSPLIESIGSSSAAPGDEIIMLGLKPKVSVGDHTDLTELKIISVDEDFFKTLRVGFIAGRNFDASSKTEANAVILNETAARLLGYDNPQEIVGQPLHNLQKNESEIVGVIKNYHQRSLQNGHEAVVFVPNWIAENNLGWNKFYYFVRLNPGIQMSDVSTVIADMEQSWKASVIAHPFSYFFLDSFFDSHYKTDTAFSLLFFFFSAFAIFISCLGIFGLVAYVTLQRTKEIGIRKVLGASVRNILLLLSKDFVSLIAIASMVAIPLVAVGLQRWLESYAFRMGLDVWLFVYPLLLIFILSLATVVAKSIRVAVANPVENIRYE